VFSRRRSRTQLLVLLPSHGFIDNHVFPYSRFRPGPAFSRSIEPIPYSPFPQTLPRSPSGCYCPIVGPQSTGAPMTEDFPCEPLGMRSLRLPHELPSACPASPKFPKRRPRSRECSSRFSGGSAWPRPHHKGSLIASCLRSAERRFFTNPQEPSLQRSSG